MNSYELQAPTSLCLYDQEHQNITLNFFSVLKSYCVPETKQITVDFSSLTYMSAAAANHLFAIFMYYQLNIDNNFFKLKLPQDKKLRDMFDKTGMHTALKSGGVKKVKKMWQNSDFLCGTNKDVPKLMQEIKKRCGVSPFPQKLNLAMRETLLNVHHHAYPSQVQNQVVTWFCYFYINEDENGRYLSTIIQDMGQGIVSSIKKGFPDFKYVSDSSCIAHAMTRKVSGTREEGRGKGSFDMMKPLIFNKLKGNDILYVISNSGSYTFEVTGEDKHMVTSGQLANQLHGTMIEWTLYY
ncbi:conserved hypothetical protein [Vibrio chagasii]|uniref:hypothetical protein n=1 Tax=Vibrio sp. T3Y01 TaxID=2607606 RepID=UPI0014935E75|nr:hypothetical protein [Vibrio sp. T3Y01]CAH6811350.1 conserved hypothetical protein [Vibrio chagasii]CAK2518916.1 STAS domain-containing protein [Vibrio crassostreae]NOI97848.1 hypothetical protein [Vibrio sp. T3Y01]CAH6837091.1 conserved hypothetical protein [Vibrio chagasii]CAH6845600.1 conserved hypothetical protein [Vibrio chagasii]